MSPWTTPLLATVLATGCGASPGIQEGDVIDGRVFLAWSLERLPDKDPLLLSEGKPLNFDALTADASVHIGHAVSSSSESA